MRKRRSWLSKQHKGGLIFLALLTVGMIALPIYLINIANTANIKIFRLNFIALLLGLVFEYRRVSGKWSTVLWTALAAYFLSFIAFSRGRYEENYVLEEHLQDWPYFFLGAFVVLAMAVQFTNLTKKITEGITLLFTIAINYWILANDHWSNGSTFVKVLIVVNVLFSLFSLFHALSYRELSKGMRVLLSVWTSIVVLVLSIDNFVQIYRYRDIEQLPAFEESAFVFFQFFLLGISSIYIAYNLTLVGAYLPGKRYLETIREMNDVHVHRFSNEQVYIIDSIIVIILSVAGFALNYFFQFLPTNFMIWAMIAITPVLLYLTHRVIS